MILKTPKRGLTLQNMCRVDLRFFIIECDLETIHTLVPSNIKKKVSQLVEKEEVMTIEDFLKLPIEKELKTRVLQKSRALGV